MKTDDDMFINLAKLNSVLRDNRKPNMLVGSLICNAVPIKVFTIILLLSFMLHHLKGLANKGHVKI